MFNADGSIKFFNILAGNETIGRFAPTPVDLYLSNTTLNGSYEATNSITVEENVTVAGPTTLKAGNSIDLKPGFTAPSGSDFTAQIGTVPNTPKRFYYLKDHLGSIRVVVNETGNIVNSDDYDPWGMILNGRSTIVAYNNAKYKFIGKERDKETGYDYFGARYYDSRIGRWMQVEPLYKKHLEWNPYNYVLDNPLSLIDPDGKQIAPSNINFGMPITLPSSWEEVKMRVYAFIGISVTTAAIYYTPGAITGVVGWWFRNPVQANEISSGVMENLSNAPTGVGTVANLGKTYGKLGTVVGKEGMAFENVLIEGHGLEKMSRGISENLLKEIVENPTVKLRQENKLVFITEKGAAVIDPNNKNKLV
ncbi:MAG TPA: RHS repeat-associated core domain-containing protein, partial [Arachidicoccus soli]|nr:RHS repeat-associated core domain-containing protein [Arachidicoccus soli]